MIKLGLQNRRPNKTMDNTQENFSNVKLEDEEDIDYSLKVSSIVNENKREEDKIGSDFAEIISSAINKVTTYMDNRLAIAKAREGIAYGLQEEGHVPPFLRFQLSCKPEVGDKDTYLELQTLWEEKSGGI